MYVSIKTSCNTSQNFIFHSSCFFDSVELLFFLLPLIFPDMAEVFVIVMTVMVVSAVVRIIITSLLLYGAHNVSSENNRMDYVCIIVIHYVLI